MVIFFCAMIKMMRQPRYLLLNGPNFRKARNNLDITTRNLRNFFLNSRWRQQPALIGNHVFIMLNNRKTRPSNINKLKIHANTLRNLSRRKVGNNALMYARLANAFQNTYNGPETQNYQNRRHNRRFNIRIKRRQKTPPRSPPKRPHRN